MIRFVLFHFFAFTSPMAFSVTECNEKIVNYFIGTSELNQSQAHLWVSFEGGGSATISSQSAAFNSVFSTVMLSVASDKAVKIRYLADDADCKTHHSDWVGLYLLK